MLFKQETRQDELLNNDLKSELGLDDFCLMSQVNNVINIVE